MMMMLGKQNLEPFINNTITESLEKKKNFCAFGFRSDSAFDPTWVKWYSGVYNHVINIVLLRFMMVLLCNCLVLD